MTRFALLVALSFSAPIVVKHTLIEEDGRRILKSPSGYQTVSMLDGGKTGLYYDSGDELVGKLRPSAHDVVLLGLGGGEMLHAAKRALPDAHFVGVEIDPAIAHAAQTTFKTDFAQVFCADAIGWISVQPPVYDVVMIDLYDDSQLVPAAMRPAFFTDCYRALRPGGIILMNVWPASLYQTVAHSAEAAGFSVWRSDTWAPNAMLVGQKSDSYRDVPAPKSNAADLDDRLPSKHYDPP